MRLLHPSSCICNVIYKKRKGSTISCCREVKALLLNLSMPMPEGCASMLLSFVYERARRGGWMRVLSRMCFQWLQILNCLKISIYEVHLSTPILVFKGSACSIPSVIIIINHHHTVHLAPGGLACLEARLWYCVDQL